MHYNISAKDLIKFLGFIFITIIITYFGPRGLSIVWYIIVLIIYYFSDDEPFWIAFFLITVDGFMGFFGLYSVTLRALPGLPAIEVAQFYILISFIKALKKNSRPYIFYKKHLTVLCLYLIFLVIWGQIMGFPGDVKDYFRLVKVSIPFLLFYSLPRLFDDIAAYERLFSLIFIVLILGFITQLFTLLTGLSITGTLALTQEQISEAGEYRGFYNIATSLLGLFGALFFLSYRQKEVSNSIFLYLVILTAFGMAVLSATRGWIISFGIVIVFSLIFIRNIKIKKVLGFVFLASLLVAIGLSNTKIREQVKYSIVRLTSLESLGEGDITAEGTLSRLSVRGPRVMKKWEENPIFGWGFSTVSRESGDGHVGNQNLLMVSGIVGFSLLIGFLISFCYKMYARYRAAGDAYSLKKGFPVFIIFLLGWFIIHSSSGQQFGYSGIPQQIIPQAVFFSFGAFVYSKSLEKSGENNEGNF